MENEAKWRYRLSQNSLSLFERTRRGEVTPREARLAHFLYRQYRHSGIVPTFTEEVSPALEGSFWKLVREGWLELYQSEGEDYFESLFPKPEEKEEDNLSELDEFEILEKGKILQDRRSHWEELTPKEEMITDCLDEIEKGSVVPLWALKVLVRDIYIRRISRGIDDIYEVVSLE